MYLEDFIGRLTKHMYIDYLPALVNLETSKSSNLSSFCRKMYSRGSETNLLRVSLLPTPLAAMFNQKILRTEGLVRKQLLVLGPKQALTKGSITPICSEIGELVSSHVNS